MCMNPKCCCKHHPEFREPPAETVEEEYLAPAETPAFLPEDWRELVPPTFENRDPLPRGPSPSIDNIRSSSRRPHCTCDARMQEPDPDWPGCCARCSGVIDRAEAMLYDSQRRKSALRNELSPEEQTKGPIRRLLEALKPTTGPK
jgi:hypothetical protein